MSDENPADGRKLVGPKKRGRPPKKSVRAPDNGLWQTDVIRNRHPDYEYQFFLESQVRDKLHATRVRLMDFDTGESEIHDIPGWEIVKRETGAEEAAGWRPDEGKPIDTVLRHGSHVAMRLPKASWDLLQRAQEQRADGYENRLQGGHYEQYDINGEQRGFSRGQKPAVSLKEHPLQRI